MQIPDSSWILAPLVIVRFGQAVEPVPHGRAVVREIVIGDAELTEPRAATLRRIAREVGPDAWLLPLDADDVLAADALERFAAAAIRHPQAELLYADHVHVDVSGVERVTCKPAWSPHMLWSENYLGRAWMIRSEVAAACPPVDGGEHAFLLAVTRTCGAIGHIPDALCWTRRSPEREEELALRRVLEPWIDTDRSALHLAPDPDSAGRWIIDLHPTGAPLVTIVVPFRDKPELLRTVARGVLEETAYTNLELLLVDTGSSDPTIAPLLVELQGDQRVRVIEDRATPFNYSAVNDRAVAQSTGELVLLLNNDIEIVEPGWLAAMVGWAVQPEIGTVGARLDYPDGLIQHAGVVLGIGGYASHPFSRTRAGIATPWGDTGQVRDVLASTAACVLLTRFDFDDVGGLDETFQLCGSDVALGLAQHVAGQWNVQLPHVRLIHHESVSRGTEIPRNDFIRSREVYAPWVGARDPFYHPALTLDDETCRLRASEADRIPPVRWSHTTRSIHA